MKVCTDACLFGAWVAEELTSTPERILDIGSGTGLLSLMLAQKHNTLIEAIEIEASAYKQTQQNFKASPFNNKIITHHSSVQSFNKSLYDFIISNPPFFENDLKSNDLKRNIALHSQQLSFTELLIHIKRLLKAGGSFALLIPWNRTAALVKLLSDYSFFLQKQALVKQTEKHDFFRTMMIVTDHPARYTYEEIIIKEKGDYSQRFRHLLKDYYLHL